MRRLFSFILLNIIVSAVTVLIVLMIWDATHRVIPAQELALGSTADVQSPITETLPPAAEGTIVIQTVIGAGDLVRERVELASVSQAPVNLQGWQLAGEGSNRFVFPSVTVFPEGELSLFTQAGVNTSGELFWGLAAAAFSPGELVQLIDSSGTVRSQYRIP